MASIRARFKKLFPGARNTGRQDDNVVIPIRLRTVSGETRMIIPAKAKDICPTCEFDPSSNSMPIFTEQSSKAKRHTEVLRTANEKDELSCACCTLVRECISIFDPEHSDHLPGHYAGFVAFGERTVSVGRDVELFALPTESFLPLGLNPRGLSTGDTSSKMAFDWFKKRMSSCALDHGWCGDGSETALPDRVIDVGSQDRDQIRLLETMDSPKSGHYIALSHCWGGKVPDCRTTKETLAARLSAIPFESLPETFRDAVIVARCLEVRYLWIDCVCIVQDDERDWQTQAAKMCDVYSQSYLTVAAVYSPDCDGGLFSVLSNEYQPREIASLTQGDSQCKVYARRVPNNFHWWDSRGFDVWAKSPPLFKRAWTYQERFLSPRVLWFTPYELQWECQEAVSCECSCSTVFFDESTTRLPPFTESSSGEFAKTRFKKEFELSSERLWSQVIDRYCHLELTKKSDKLAAIAGIAQKVGRTRPSARYLAGLWSDTLAEDLLWGYNNGGKLGEPHPYKPLPATYRAPSWSWAAVEGHLQVPSVLAGWGAQPIEVMVSILECSCEYVDDNPFSKVLSGRLTVMGTIHQCRAAVFKDNNTWCVRPRTSKATLLRELMPDYEWGSACFAHGGIKPGTKVHLLRWAKDRHWIYYLVLLKTDKELGSFRRIGILLINHYEESRKKGPRPSHITIEAQVFESSTVSTVTII